MSSMIYGIVGIGTITEDQIAACREQGRILWRQEGGILEVWNYATGEWDRTDAANVRLEDLVRLEGDKDG